MPRPGWTTAPVAVAYALLLACAVLVFVSSPSTTLVNQGGRLIVNIWAAFCLFGGTAGVLGLWARLPVLEILGSTLGSVASLTWSASLVMHAVQSGTAVPLTAACMAAAVGALFTHRGLDVRVRS